jgi:hypothetical protein
MGIPTVNKIFNVSYATHRNPGFADPAMSTIPLNACKTCRNVTVNLWMPWLSLLMP